MKKYSYRCSIAIMFLFLWVSNALAVSEMVIVTGGTGGNYYKVAKNISDLLNKSKDNSYKWSVKPLQGKYSRDVLQYVFSENLPLAFAQSDIVGGAASGTLGETPKNVRVIISLYPESGKYAGHWANLVTNADMPEDVVYEITKLLYENKEAFDKKDTDLKKADWTKPYEGIERAKFHKGAIKYYEEIGIEIPKQYVSNKD